VFHEDIPDDYVTAVFDVMARADKRCLEER
jgi:hypothetical protein